MVIVLTKTLDTYYSPCAARRTSAEYTKCDFFQIYAFIWSKQNLSEPDTIVHDNRLSWAKRLTRELSFL